MTTEQEFLRTSVAAESKQRCELSYDINRDPQPSTLNPQPPGNCHVALLTGGWDKPYALGLTAALVGQGIAVDFLGNSELDAPELHDDPKIHFVSLQAAPRPGGGLADKALRTLTYYWRTIRYAVTARPKVFHILWNTKVQFIDRTLLLLFYKLLGKRVVFTAHNVNAGKRDGNDTWWNRLTLRVQYRVVDHVFVHTPRMKAELIRDFGVLESRTSVIPFGINTTVPNTELTGAQARERLGLDRKHKVILFFGNILPYKGLEYLVAAFAELAKENPDYRLVIAGKPKTGDPYFKQIQETISNSAVKAQVVGRFEYVPDEETELYFKAADVLVLPYVHIFQSGVLFLAYNFGLPVIAADVGSLGEEIIQEQTGFLCKPQDPKDLAETTKVYFSGSLFNNLAEYRPRIRAYANDRYSWSKVGEIVNQTYLNLLRQFAGHTTR